MNTVILFIIGIPAIEIYLMIKVGGIIGALNTILLIFFTAITGVYFANKIYCDSINIFYFFKFQNF